MLATTSNPGCRKLRIVLTGGLGDCLLATPFIRHFRQSKRYDTISCVVPRRSKEIFDLNPHITQLILCDDNELLFWAAPEKDFDVFSPYVTVNPPAVLGGGMTLDISRTIYPNRSNIPLVRQVAEHHGLKLADERLEIHLSKEDEAWSDALLARWRPAPAVLIHTSSALPEKNLPQQTAQQVVDSLKTSLTIVQFPGVALLSGTDTIAPMPRIRQSAALIQRLQGVITVDSFPGHLARAVGTPAVVIFGPSNPNTFGHDGNDNIRVSSCPPCADTPRRKTCERSLCLEEVTAEHILRGVRSVMYFRLPEVSLEKSGDIP